MPIRRPPFILLAAALSLSACAPLPPIFATPADAPPEAEAPLPSAAPPQTVAVPPPVVRAPSFAAAPAAAAERAAPRELERELKLLTDNLARRRRELEGLRQALQQDSAAYYGLVATLVAQSRREATADDPLVAAPWDEARSALQWMSEDVARIETLSHQAETDAALVTRLIAASRVGGDDDALAQIEAEAQAALLETQWLRRAMADDVRRERSHVAAERGTLSQLAAGFGNGQKPAASLAAATPAKPKEAAESPLAAALRPFVTIRFGQKNTDYEEPLYKALKTALERRPAARFDLVPVAPQDEIGDAESAAAATQNGEDVMHALMDMGLPEDRVRLSNLTGAAVEAAEVRLFIRTGATP